MTVASSGRKRAARRQVCFGIGGEPVEAPGAAEEEAGALVLVDMAAAGHLNCHTADRVQRSLRSSGLSRDSFAGRCLSLPLEAPGGAAQLDDPGHYAQGNLLGFAGLDVKTGGGVQARKPLVAESPDFQICSDRFRPSGTGNETDVRRVGFEGVLKGRSPPSRPVLARRRWRAWARG